MSEASPLERFARPLVPGCWPVRSMCLLGLMPGKESEMECHKLDNEKQVFFYEQDFYVLSNFSAFRIDWKGRTFDTSEAAYHWEKFPDEAEVQDMILDAPSAHQAFKIAESQKMFRRQDWDAVKVGIMRDILRAKAEQHEYVRRKLLDTGDRELIEDSWRDDVWGWGPNRDGQNLLGKLWMEVRAELRSLTPNTNLTRAAETANEGDAGSASR